MMRSSLFALSCVGAVACAGDSSGPSTTPPPTAAVAQVRALGGAVAFTTLLTTGDSLPSSPLTFAPAPHGVGLVQDTRGKTLFVVHDIGVTPITSSTGGAPIQYARVTQLVLNNATGQLVSAGLAEDGRSQYRNFRSGGVGDDKAPNGSQEPTFFTGEAAGATPAGAGVVKTAAVGARPIRLAQGAIWHAGQASLPDVVYHREVVMLLEDGTPGASRVYLYRFDGSFEQLYVLRALIAPGTSHAASIAPGDSLRVEWAPLVDRPDTLVSAASRYARLQALGDSAGALPFVRLSDMDLDRSSLSASDQSQRGDRAPAVFLADRGDPSVRGRVAGAVNAPCAGTCDAFGSIYRLDLDPTLPSNPGYLVHLLRSGGPATGWASPGTVASSFTTILVGEAPLHPAFDNTRSASIWRGTLAIGQASGFTRVAEVTQGSAGAASCSVSAGTCWDIGDIAYVEAALSPIQWAVTIRAHTLGFTSKGQAYGSESGQLLLMRQVP